MSGLVDALTQLSHPGHPGGYGAAAAGAWPSAHDGQAGAQMAQRPHGGASSALGLSEDGHSSTILLQYLSDNIDAATAAPQTSGPGDDTTLIPGLALYDAPGGGGVVVRPATSPDAAGSGSLLGASNLGGQDGYHHATATLAGATHHGHHHHAGHHHQHHAGTAGDATSQGTPDAQHGAYIHPSLQLPNSILVTQATDPMQAAGLINFTFSQSPHSFFVLNTLAGNEQGVTNVAVLNVALRVVLSARKINQHAVARFDLGFVPFVVSDAADGVGLLVYKCSISPEVAKARGQVLKMDASSNPLVAGLSLFNMLQSSTQQLEVIFTADAAKVALQALAIMRINLANNGRDVLLLASTIEYAADAAGPKSYYLLKLTPTTPTLPCFQHQIDVPKPPMVAHGGGPYGVGDDAVIGRLQQPGAKPYGDQGLPMGQGPMPYLAPAHAAKLVHGGQQRGAPPMVPMVSAAAMHPHMLVPGVAAPGGAAKGVFALVPGPAPKQHRARKADYVIVTEDTAIKNAAGAVAKVLGRVAGQGQCCPVYTEKKTESFTTVISVAVKAIAVARGYVCNEGMGAAVGFQPYLRHLDRRLDLDLLHQFLADRKASAASSSGGPAAAGLAHLQTAAAMGGGGRGMLPGPGGLKAGGGGGLEVLDLLDEEAMHDERCELAFDVFKLPQFNELQDAGNLPVKVTAHSRPHVVSNIISKLVSEREGAVLITAGGKAMHVAMTAVVSARARLKAKGIDIILLPKFVTVDTTSTLGWESVFLRFTIVRWSPMLLPLADPALVPDAVAGRAAGYLMVPQLG